MDFWVVATQIFVMFTPKFGKDSHVDKHVFQMGGSTTNLSQCIFPLSVLSGFGKLRSTGCCQSPAGKPDDEWQGTKGGFQGGGLKGCWFPGFRIGRFVKLA